MGQQRNYNARAGQRIVGNLYRGSSGKFQSGPTDEGLKKLGIERDLSDALINAVNNKDLTPEQLSTLKAQGYVDESGILTSDGRSLALALRAKNLTNAQKILNKTPKKTGGGGGGKVDKKTQNRKTSRAAIQTLGFSPQMIDALFSFFDGEEIETKQLNQFAKKGLIQIDDDGLASLTQPGRLLRTGVDAGDKRKIQDALARGSALAKKQTAVKEDWAMIDFDNETAVDDTNFGEFEEYGYEMPWIDFDVTSFAQLETMKQAQEMRENVMKTTNAFQMLVNNIIRGESDDKIGDLQQLFTEYTSILRGVLDNDSVSENETTIEETAITVHHTAIVENEPWDGSAARANAPNDAKVLRYMSAWFNENGDPNAKSSYKFPHHAPRIGAGANIRAVNNGLARLSQADVPAEERAAIESHLRSHRVDAGLQEFMTQDEIKTAVNVVALAEGFSKEIKADLLTAVSAQELEFAENNTQFDVMGTAVSLMESYATPDTPLYIDVRLIKPGWGNRRDNNYYPRDVLKRDVNIFNGIKMHVTNHDLKEQNDRYWVSTIVEAGERFDDDGAPIVRTAVHSPDFARRARNLQELGLLHMLQCSIVAGGKVRPNYSEGGRTGSFVERMTVAQSVDWVTRAGAGGQALNLVESFAEDKMHEDELVEDDGTIETTLTENDNVQTDETAVDNENANAATDETAVESNNDETPTFLERDVVEQTLNGTTLPDVARNRILLNEYDDQNALNLAIQQEIEYIASVTGVPQAHQFGATTTTAVVEFDEAAAEERFEKIFSEFGLQ